MSLCCLKSLDFLADTALSANLLHAMVTRSEKKFLQISKLLLGLIIFSERPLVWNMTTNTQAILQPARNMRDLKKTSFPT